MLVRLAEADEWERIRDVRLRALLDAPDAFGSTFELEAAHEESDWRTWIAGGEGSEDQALFVAEDDEALVGLVIGVRWTEHPDPAHLYAMWVDPRAREAGVGRALVDAVCQWASTSGTDRLHLCVSETNDGAAAMYERCGFADTGERTPLREGSPLLAVHLERAL
jgi:ribosomal protein S18 acetylase RimI-like enzyme